jgi:sugar-specific transcriptional regulator TrmB
MKYATQLQKLGFTENEANVYLANLRVGNARVSHIAEEAGLPKSTTNDTLEALLTKGLVSRYKHKNRFHFAAAEPDVLSQWLERKQSLLADLLPKLQATKRAATAQPSIRYYLDENGFYTIEREIITEAKEVLLISPAKDLEVVLPHHFKNFMTDRLTRNIRARILIEDSPIATHVRSLDHIANHETRIIQPPAPFESLLLIWNNKVATISLDAPISIVIHESKPVTHMLISLFELLWDTTSLK